VVKSIHRHRYLPWRCLNYITSHQTVDSRPLENNFICYYLRWLQLAAASEQNLLLWPHNVFSFMAQDVKCL